MEICARSGRLFLFFALLSNSIACAPTDSDLGLTESEELDDPAEQDTGVDKGLVSDNGLSVINGLTSSNGFVTTNGLSVTNGLSLTNGLTLVNGLPTMNGLATRDGLTSSNGKLVNCYGQPDSACTSPNGLLSNTTGLMKNAEGVVTAQYLIRCALPASRVIRVPDYTGAFVSMQGQLGVAPEWETKSCSTACEEKVSACMLAFINQDGRHRSITMTAGWAGNPFGTSHLNYNVLEGAFFGNIFKTTAEAYVASGYDHAQTVTDVEKGLLRSEWGLALRSCNQAGSLARTYQKFLDALPYCSVTNVGTSAPSTSAWPALRTDATKYDKCSFATTDAAYNGIPSKSTALACSGPGTSTRNWKYVISTWRRENPWLFKCSTANEGSSAQLSCAGGGKIYYISFASYGNPPGVCGGTAKGTCHAATSQSVVENACLGKESCTVAANNATFGDPCPGTPKKLFVSYGCEN